MATKKATEKAASTRKPAKSAAVPIDGKAETPTPAPKPPAPKRHLRVIALQAENIKRISLVRIRPKGNMVLVSGENGSGKTSLLDSLAYAIMGERGMPSDPIRKGKNTAKVQVDLGDLQVTRHFTRIHGGKEPYLTTLTIEGKNREKYPSPQSILDGIKGVISFDPQAFTGMDDRKQLETLRKLVVFDVDLDAIDAAKKEAYDKRRDVGRDIDGAKARLKSAIVPVEGLPEKPIDTAELTKKLEGAAAMNGRRAAALQEKRNQDQQADSATDRAKSARARAEELRRQAEEM